MSGKSTLLRSIGLAAVMAQAGSVVCARRLRLSPLRTFTSMRIRDSLTEGVSHFMAELQRLKALVDAADHAGPGRPALLYLIDEVLQGTNSEERRIAARHIVSHLLDAHAVGAVTTHDLSLHEEDRVDAAAKKVHFRETVGAPDAGPVLTFDYVLRPGLATSRNALKLLEVVGLGGRIEEPRSTGPAAAAREGDAELPAARNDERRGAPEA
jgi:DNA mismatch repair ATPase MutS